MASKTPNTTAAAVPTPAPDQDKNARVICSRMTMQPNQTNGRGKIFGGELLKVMDLAGAYMAHRACKNRFIGNMVTRVMREVEFTQPVEVNDSITAYGTLEAIGNTSVTVRIDIEADRGNAIIPVTRCIMVFVNVDDNNKPVSIHDGECAKTDKSTTDGKSTDKKKKKPGRRSPTRRRKTRP